MKPHKHAELIKAWADGAEIEQKAIDGTWRNVSNLPCFYEDYEYRIKPEPKPDVVKTMSLFIDTKYHLMGTQDGENLKLTFDGETGKLKSAEVLK